MVNNNVFSLGDTVNSNLEHSINSVENRLQEIEQESIVFQTQPTLFQLI